MDRSYWRRGPRYWPSDAGESLGYVAIQFSQVEMPDGTVEKVDASAMSLNFGPLKGDVSGKKTGTKFLVRSLTGMGTIASYVVGPQGSAVQRFNFSQHVNARAPG